MPRSLCLAVLFFVLVPVFAATAFRVARCPETEIVWCSGSAGACKTGSGHDFGNEYYCDFSRSDQSLAYCDPSCESAIPPISACVSDAVYFTSDSGGNRYKKKSWCAACSTQGTDGGSVGERRANPVCGSKLGAQAMNCCGTITATSPDDPDRCGILPRGMCAQSYEGDCCSARCIGGYCADWILPTAALNADYGWRGDPATSSSATVRLLAGKACTDANDDTCISAHCSTPYSVTYSSVCCPSADVVVCSNSNCPSDVAGCCKYNDGHSCSLASDCCTGACVDTDGNAVNDTCSCTGATSVPAKVGFYKTNSATPTDARNCRTTCTPDATGKDSANCITRALSGGTVYCDSGLSQDYECLTCNPDGTVQYVDWDGNTVAGESGTCEYSCGASIECDEQLPDSAFCTSDCQSRLLDVYVFPVETSPA